MPIARALVIGLVWGAVMLVLLGFWMRSKNEPSLNVMVTVFLIAGGVSATGDEGGTAEAGGGLIVAGGSLAIAYGAYFFWQWYRYGANDERLFALALWMVTVGALTLLILIGLWPTLAIGLNLREDRPCLPAPPYCSAPWRCSSWPGPPWLGPLWLG